MLHTHVAESIIIEFCVNIFYEKETCFDNGNVRKYENYCPFAIAK